MGPRDQDYADFLDAVHEHQGILARICSFYADSSADRDDLRQEILLQAWRSHGSFRGDCAFSTWLYRVALNTALLGRRRRAVRREVPLDSVQEEGLAQVGAAEEDPDLARLQAAVRELPELDRAVVLLWLEKQSYAEIAAITGLSTSAVGARLTRLKERLRNTLGGGGARP